MKGHIKLYKKLMSAVLYTFVVSFALNMCNKIHFGPGKCDELHINLNYVPYSEALIFISAWKFGYNLFQLRLKNVKPTNLTLLTLFQANYSPSLESIA